MLLLFSSPVGQAFSMEGKKGRETRGEGRGWEPGMVGGPARDLALSRPFWQGGRVGDAPVT